MNPTDDTAGPPALVTTFARVLDLSSTAPDRTVEIGANTATAGSRSGEPSMLLVGLYRNDAGTAVLTHAMHPDDAELLGNALLRAAKKARRRGGT